MLNGKLGESREPSFSCRPAAAKIGRHARSPAGGCSVVPVVIWRREKGEIGAARARFGIRSARSRKARAEEGDGGGYILG
jgi:hypothetical protein